MKKFNFKKFLLFLVLLGIICAASLVGIYFFCLTSPSKKTQSKIIYIEEGSSYSTIGTLLKENGLIRSEIAYKIYIRLHPQNELTYGNYKLKTTYDIEELLSVLEKGSNVKPETITVAFKEGKNFRNIVYTITNNFNITEEEIYKKITDKKYLDELINDYWFLTEDIKNEELYYSLEGYLYPDTYEFYKTADVDDILRKLLNNFEKKIEDYKDSISSSSLSLSETITLASIIELEAGSADRHSVSGVFHNRLKVGMTLGSDVTGYYGAKMDDWTNGLGSHLNDCNGYNTRGTCVKGLPIGPICNPTIKSIEAAINPESHNNYYFVADCQGKTYLSKDYNTHINTINRLKREGAWCDK